MKTTLLFIEGAAQIVPTPETPLERACLETIKKYQAVDVHPSKDFDLAQDGSVLPYSSRSTNQSVVLVMRPMPPAPAATPALPPAKTTTTA